MSGVTWTKPELKKLRQEYSRKPEWVTDYEYSMLLTKTFKRSAESIRWQMRQLHREVSTVQPAKILLLDIETLPINADVWDVWKQNIYMEQIRKDWSILCWAAKWLYDENVMGQVVTPQEAIARKDGSVLMKVWELVNEADIVVWHNGNNFDKKKLNARWILNGYPKPMYYQSVDTKQIANDNFAFTYSKLDWISQIFGIGRKVETEFKWWTECGNGNKEYLSKMLEYNKMDIHLEEEVYLKLRPWAEKHPNLATFANVEGGACSNCGSTNIHWKGKYSTPLGLYKAFRCEQCGAIGRSTKKKYKLASSETQG